MSDQTTEHGPAALQAFKDATGLSDETLGSLTGASGVSFLNWRTGRSVPTYAYRIRIKALTSEVDVRGAVTKPGIGVDTWDSAEVAFMALGKPLAQALAEVG